MLLILSDFCVDTNIKDYKNVLDITNFVAPQKST